MNIWMPYQKEGADAAKEYLDAILSSMDTEAQQSLVADLINAARADRSSPPPLLNLLVQRLNQIYTDRIHCANTETQEVDPDPFVPTVPSADRALVPLQRPTQQEVDLDLNAPSVDQALVPLQRSTQLRTVRNGNVLVIFSQAGFLIPNMVIQEQERHNQMPSEGLQRSTSFEAHMRLNGTADFRGDTRTLSFLPENLRRLVTAAAIAHAPGSDNQ